MDEDTVDEVEIKIEYNESYDTDPLCDKKVKLNHLESTTEIDVYCNSNGSNSNHFLPSKIPGTEPHVISNDEFSRDEFFHSYSNKSYEHTRERDHVLSWYKAVDDSGKFICKFCILKYSTLQTLRFHVKRKHTEQVKHIKENLVRCKRTSKFKCHICKQIFIERLALKSHVDNYHLLTNLKTSCLHCDATFGTENEMSEHIFIRHKKVLHKSTYICNLCGYRTSVKSHYNQHKNTHDGVKTKKCQHCDYITNYLPNLKIHERIHTEDKVYVCDVSGCDYKCTAKSALRSHQLKHNPEDNLLYCDKCNYRTIYRQCLKRHSDCHNRNSEKLKLL